MISSEQTTLVEELDAFDLQWRTTYKSVSLAAKAAGVEAEYEAWLATPDGDRYLKSLIGVSDWTAENERNRARVDAERKMAARRRT